MLDQNQLKIFIRLAKSLEDTVTVQILNTIINNPHIAPKDIYENHHKMPQSSMSRHLSKLKTAGLIDQMGNTYVVNALVLERLELALDLLL